MYPECLLFLRVKNIQMFFLVVSFSLLLIQLSAFSETSKSDDSYQSLFDSPLDSDSLVSQFSEIEEKINRASPLKAQFRQIKEIEGLQKPLISEGKIFFSVDNGIIWEIVSPISLKTAMTSDGSVITDSDSEEGESEQAVSRRYMKIITSLFSGDVESLQKVFSVFFTKNNDNSMLIGLIPQKRAMSRFINRIVINISKTGYISTFLLSIKNGGYYKIVFFNHTSIPANMIKEELKKI